MARFPRVEPGISELAQKMAAGLAANAAVYPAPPVSAAELEAALTAYVVAREAAVAAQAAAEQATAVKSAALQALVENMKVDIRYAEDTVKRSGPKLALIAWDARKRKSRLRAPGQVLALEARREGPGWIMLGWKKPVDGGAPRVYKIQERSGAESQWRDAGIAMATEITLHDRERGKEGEYRVVAVNRAGEGEPSNTVVAVL